MISFGRNSIYITSIERVLSLTYSRIQADIIGAADELEEMRTEQFQLQLFHKYLQDQKTSIISMIENFEKQVRMIKNM